MDCARIATKLREQILRFSGELSLDLPKVGRRFVTEMIYGIQARQSVRLSEVGRALGEETPIKKIVERLSRQLRRPDLASHLTNRLLRVAESQIDVSTLLILDLSDLQKKYAKKMEHLATVRDGSEKTEGPGYWTLHVVATEIASSRLIPLYGRLFSQNAPDYISENEEITKALRIVSEKTAKRGIWVMDRGGDRGYLYKYLLHEKLKFIIRLRADRTLVADGEASALTIAEGCPGLFNEYIAREEKTGEHPLQLEVGCRKVRLPGRTEELTLVVVRGFGQEPMMLLTNLPVKKSRKSIWHAAAAYLSRWRIEETIRFLKQSYQLEDIRVLKYVRLQNLMVLVTAVVYFTAVFLGTRLKLRVLAGHVIRAALRVFGIPNFRLYALADGIKRFLFNPSKGLGLSPPPSEPRFVQRLMFAS